MFQALGQRHFVIDNHLQGRVSMKRILPVLLAAGVLYANAAMAAASPADLAKAKGCMSCHAVNKKSIGPSFHAIAVKYAGNKLAADKLTLKVLHGGSGVWGKVPMPRQSGVTESEASVLVKWVLSQK